MALNHGMSLQAIVEAVRGQTSTDFRPNKAMHPGRFTRLLDGYKHKELLVQIAREGIKPSWKQDSPTQTKPMKNHASASRHLNGVLKAIRKGQEAGQYLVLESKVLQTWKNIQISPLGAVTKKDCDPEEDIRLIHDLSFSRGNSTNDMSNIDVSPDIEYKHVAAIAQRIVSCRSRFKGEIIKIMKGDVKGAFRHLMLASGHVQWMAATIPEMGVLIIDMSAPFGWTSSPAFYGAFGGAITWLVSRESPMSMDPRSTDLEPFLAYEWVDDHVMVEPDIGNRLNLANETLRLAMIAVLGPGAINEEKFSTWQTQLQVLGLEFDTNASTISMPRDKIEKALGRVQELRNQRHTTRTQLQQLLGSLRHVCSCLRAARPFYQRIHAACVRAPRYGKVAVNDQILQDLQWFEIILGKGQLEKLPLSMYTKSQPAEIHLYMDASNNGLAVLDPAMQQYIQIRFDKDEQDLIRTSTGSEGFNINVREQLCVALAVWVFGPAWTSNHSTPFVFIKAWSDNTSAVSWTNRLSSPNPMAQEINRAIGLAEGVFGLRVECEHLPGAINTMADAGSRAWTPPQISFGLTYRLRGTRYRSLRYYARFTRASHPTSVLRIGLWIKTEVQRHLAKMGRVVLESRVRRTVSSGATLSTKTVLSAISHISWYHMRDRGYSVGLHAGHKLAVRGMQRLSLPTRQKQPVTFAILQEIRSRCNFRTTLDRVLWGAAVVGFFFLLRRSEYLADGKRVKPYIIRAKDIKFLTDKGTTANQLSSAITVSVHFRGSKTDQAGSGTTRTLHRSGSSWLCPVLAAWELTESSRKFDQNEALCSTGPGKVLTANALGNAIKNAAKAIGADQSCFGTHSMRSGGATSMFAAGIDRLTIKLFGRWASDAYERYTRINETVAKALASQMTKGTMSRVSPATPKWLRPARNSSRTS